MKAKKYLLPEAEALRQFVESAGSVPAVAKMLGVPNASIYRWISGHYPPNSTSREQIRDFLEDQGATVGDRVAFNPAYQCEAEAAVAAPTSGGMDPDGELENIDEEFIDDSVGLELVALRREVVALCSALEYAAGNSRTPSALAAYFAALASESRQRLKFEA